MRGRILPRSRVRFCTSATGDLRAACLFNGAVQRGRARRITPQVGGDRFRAIHRPQALLSPAPSAPASLHAGVSKKVAESFNNCRDICFKAANNFRLLHERHRRPDADQLNRLAHGPIREAQSPS